MIFHIDVTGTAIDNSNIESSYEFNGLNDALERAEAEYAEVIRLSRSYAIGNAGDIRENENTDFVTFYFTKEKKELCEAIINAYKKGKKLSDPSSYTRGLYYRGAQ